MNNNKIKMFFKSLKMLFNVILLKINKEEDKEKFDIFKRWTIATNRSNLHYDQYEIDLYRIQTHVIIYRIG